MIAHQPQDGLSLDERIRRAEREVMLHDRRVMQRLDQVTTQTRNAARSGGRVALIGAGALLSVWAGWRVYKAVRPDPKAKARERERARQAAYRYGHGLADVPVPPDQRPGIWGQLGRLGLILAPFVLPARSPAAAAASAFAPGGWWPMRIFRVARTAMDWRAAQQAKRAEQVNTARAERAEAGVTPPRRPRY